MRLPLIVLLGGLMACTPTAAPPDEAAESVPEVAPIRALLDSGQAHFHRTVFEAAEADYRAALSQAEGLPPGAARETLRAEAHLALAVLGIKSGQPEAAAEALDTGLEILTTAGQEGTLLGAQLTHYRGVLWLQQGALMEAQGALRQARDQYRTLGATDRLLGELEMWLGNTALARGDLPTADGHYQAAGEFFRRQQPDGILEAWSLQNRGLVAQARRDFDTAERFLERCYAIRHAANPRGHSVAISLTNFGSLALDRGDPEAAQGYFEAALEIIDVLMPDTLDAALLRADLARAAHLRGDLTQAEAHHRQAQALFDRLAPGSVDSARNRMYLGQLAHEAGRIAEALEALERATALLRRRAPHSTALAEALDALAAVHRERGEPTRAVEMLRAAVTALEGQRRQLGGAREEAARFAAHFAGLYHRLIALEVALGSPEAAFLTLERYRGQALRAHLAERDLDLSRGLPPALLVARAAADREYEATRARLESLPGDAPPERVLELITALRVLRHRQGEIADALRRRVPRFGAVEPPEPLGAAAVAAALDPGTTLLSYSVTDDETFLFVISRAPGSAPPLQLFRLGIGGPALAARVQSYRDLLRLPDPATLPALITQGRALHALLIPPELSAASAASAGHGTRWLILPDGPLHFLPFAALVMPRVGEDPSPRYLVEERSLLTALSATLYGTREGGAPRTLVAVGDPLSNAALPGARREAVAVAALFPGRARVLLGKAAREAAIKALEPGVSHLHFAAHAAIDARFPLDSYLALAPSAGSVVGVTGETGEGDNGRLYAWEIYEQLRLDADLVVLSACETARGDALGGDGVLGLAQAFRHAGAEAVIASLWRVSDRATVPVMERLYRALRDGASKEEALAIAQRGAIRSQDLGQSHPYHWAAFQLIN